MGRRIAAFIEGSKRGIVAGAAAEPDGADLPEGVL